MTPNKKALLLPLKRIRVWYGLLLLCLAIFGLRLFYLQVIRYDHYKTAALSDQLKQYEIPATRGIISAYDGGASVPIVLNQTLYTIYADPVYIKHPNKVAATLSEVLGGQVDDYKEKVTREGRRYVILAKKVPKATKEKLMKYEYAGVGAQAQSFRVYPQGSLAAQLLGFVNSDGEGVYGVEQALNKTLTGKPGRLKAITDVHGVPLANKGNVSVPAVNGKKVQLTIDLGMQKRMEDTLKHWYGKTKPDNLSAIIMDPRTGQIKAMANYPTYDPAHTSKVTNLRVFQNAAVSRPIEPGSTMKPLTVAAALDQGVVTPTTTFYDPAQWTVDKYKITDIEEDGGAREQSIASTLELSLNTGVTWLLMRLSGSNDTINLKGVNTWHDYMTKHYQFGKDTNIEQGYEANGIVPSNNPSQPAIHLRFATTTFGQGVQTTALQMAGALSSVINGGTYYRPTLISSLTDQNGHVTPNRPKVVRTGVVRESTSKAVIPLMQGVVRHYREHGFSYLNFPDNYVVGGKTGSAQVSQPGGGYSSTVFNGTYMGFVGGDTPQYVVVVYNVHPKVSGYAGSHAAQPVFADLVHMLIDNGYVVPKR